ncbi:MAG: DUF1579 domain-containing protein [Planctomycetota bacterium]
MSSRTSWFGLRGMAGCLAAALALGFFAGRVVSDEPGGKKGEPKMSAEEEAMMKKMAEMGTPGPHHKHLDAMAGNWETSTRFWMAPGQEGEVTKGTCKRKWILGGRFLTEEFEGEAMGQPFSGFGVSGYDNVSKKYVSTWADTMTTGIMSSTGTCDAAGKLFTYMSESNDCMTGQLKKVRCVTRVASESKHVFEMYDKDPEGKEFKSLEVIYTRK